MLEILAIVAPFLLAAAGSGAIALGAGHFASANIEDPAALRDLLRQQGMGSLADQIPG